MLNIYVNTWGNYNENGADGGRWVNLPCDPDTLDDILRQTANRMQDENLEWFVNDFSWDDYELGHISENSNIFRLNELAEGLDLIPGYDLEAIEAAMEAIGYDLEEALEAYRADRLDYAPGRTLEEYAEELVRDCYELPEFALRYFDYEAFARDLRFDGYHETTNGVICIR